MAADALQDARRLDAKKSTQERSFTPLRAQRFFGESTPAPLKLSQDEECTCGKTSPTGRDQMNLKLLFSGGWGEVVSATLRREIESQR